MMTEQSMLRRIGPIALGLALLAGCSSSQPTQFYTLSALVSDSRPDERSTIRLGVGPIALPAYLDRPQVVTRSGNSRMTVADFHQWAEPLETSFQRVLKENLSSRLGTDDVVMLPSRRGLPLDHQVEIDVTRFDADQTGEVVLDARWLIFDGRGDRLQESGRSVVKKPFAAAGDYEAIAEAMSQGLGAMSADIAKALDAL